MAGFSAAELHRRITETLAEDSHYEVANLGQDRVRLARSYRPTWAIVAAIVTAPFVGLGLLFLLVKRTESCDVTVVDGPTSAVVTINGRMLLTTKSMVERAVDRDAERSASQYVEAPPAARTDRRPPERPAVAPPPRSVASVDTTDPAVMPVPVSAPPPSATGQAQPDTADPSTVMRTASSTVVNEAQEPPTRARSGAVGAPARIKVQLNSDVVDLTNGQPLFVGRDPVGDGRCVSVGNDAIEVSKTHLCVWVEQGRIKVRDLHSTNGTSVVDSTGQEQALVADVALTLSAGDVVHFGGQTLTVLTTS